MISRGIVGTGAGKREEGKGEEQVLLKVWLRESPVRTPAREILAKAL